MSNKSVALEKVRFMRYKPIPVMKTEFSLWSFSHKEKPVFITENPVLIAGIPVMKTGFSLWEKLHREKEAITLYQNKSEILYNVGILTSCCTVFWIAFMNFWNGISDLIFLINTFFCRVSLIFRKKYCHNLGDFVEQKTLNTVARYFIQIHVLFEIFWFLFIVAPFEEWLLYSTDGAVNYRAISTLQLQGNIKSPLS